METELLHRIDVLSCNISFSSLPVFLPTILNEMGFSPIHSQGLSAPSYFLAFIVVIASTYIAVKYLFALKLAHEYANHTFQIERNNEESPS